PHQYPAGDGLDVAGRPVRNPQLELSRAERPRQGTEPHSQDQKGHVVRERAVRRDDDTPRQLRRSRNRRACATEQGGQFDGPTTVLSGEAAWLLSNEEQDIQAAEYASRDEDRPTPDEHVSTKSPQIVGNALRELILAVGSREHHTGTMLEPEYPDKGGTQR